MRNHQSNSSSEGRAAAQSSATGTWLRSLGAPVLAAVCCATLLLASGCARDPHPAAVAAQAAPSMAAPGKTHVPHEIHHMFETEKRNAVVAELPPQF